MITRREVEIPSLVRLKPGALDRIGLYLRRAELERVAILHSRGLPETLVSRVQTAVAGQGIAVDAVHSVESASVEEAGELTDRISPDVSVIVGIGGGRAIDVAKLVATRRDRPMYCIPTSLSNDGFASPQSSLTQAGRRQAFAANLPSGVVVDTEVCLAAPKILWLSGVGDLVAKLTAVRDWKLAFHHDGTPVDDFAALLSDASVFQFLGYPEHDVEGIQLLATALMLNGVSMAISGNSRPASGSEHLISHALDSICETPHLHGLQVGMATYLVSHLHGAATESIRHLFAKTGFWQAIREQPFRRGEWRAAIQMAPEIKKNFHSILSERDCTDELLSIVDSDPTLDGCFV